MTKRLFIASQIPVSHTFSQMYEKLRNIFRQDSISWQKLHNNHLTYKFLGETPESIIPDILSQMRNAAINIQEFEIDIDQIGIFGSRYAPRLIWFGIKRNKSLMQLAENIRLSMQKIGFEINRENFVPHLTIGRIHKIHDKKKLQQIRDLFQHEKIQTSTISYITLFESKLTPSGAIYTPVENINLEVRN